MRFRGAHSPDYPPRHALYAWLATGVLAAGALVIHVRATFTLSLPGTRS